MKRVKSDLILWRILSIGYFVCIFLSILPIAVFLQLLLDAWPSLESVKTPTWASLLGAAVVLACITLCLRTALIRRSSRRSFTHPCEIALGVHSEADFLVLLAQNIKLKRIAENAWYGKEKGRRDLRVFVFAIHGDCGDLSIAETTVERINQETHFPDVITADMHQTRGRVQFFLFDSVPPSVIDTGARAVESLIEQSEFCVNLFVDLNTGKLCVPFCRSRLLGTGRLYQYAIRRVENWLNL